MRLTVLSDISREIRTFVYFILIIATTIFVFSALFSSTLSASSRISTFHFNRTFKTTAKTFSFLQNLGGGSGAAPNMNVDGPPPIIVPAKAKHTATIIFFHGLGDQGNGWAQVFKEDIKFDHVKTICPNAGVRPVSLNFGMPMPAWYDILGLTDNSPEDAAGIQRAAEYVHGLVNAEIKAGIPSERIVLGGFSMGGALAIYAGLTFDKPLAAIVGLSSFLLQRDKIPGSHTANLKTPVFLGHGTQDPLVPFDFGKRTHEAISKFNPNSQLKSYPMDHTSCASELKDCRDFLANILK
jgi:lysophospholipase-2